ncbi:MAG: YihY/virulence factor BrkB family protein [Candidatus Rokubacteria bacterium]|nr:YihY/virulence factor BrkB family protein [Candidatus Rokubacteria bacterium]
MPSPWRLGGLPLRELAAHVRREIVADAAMDRAAAFSYYVLFALFPTLLFLTTLLGIVAMPSLMDALLVYSAGVLPGDVASLVRRTLAEVVSGAHGSLLSVGAFVALWAASSGMMAIMTSLNVTYDVVDARPWWRRRLTALGLTFAFGIFTLAGLLLLVLGPRMGEAVAGFFGLGRAFAIVWHIAHWPAVIVLLLTGITLVYYLAPAIDGRWRWATPGSVFALVAWLGMSFGLRLYVTHGGDYNAAYGSIGGVILLMLWLYLSGLTLLVGAEIDAEIARAGRGP